MIITNLNDLTAQQKLTIYRDMKKELAPMLKQLKQIEKDIRAEVLTTGELISIEGAKTAFRKGYIRTSWDNKKLRGYAVAHPEIMEFCKESEIGPTVAIKLE